MRSRKYFWFFAISTVGVRLVRINIKGLLSLVQYMYVYPVEYLRVKKDKMFNLFIVFPLLADAVSPWRPAAKPE